MLLFSRTPTLTFYSRIPHHQYFIFLSLHDFYNSQNLDDKISNPGAPRANIAIDAEHPQGTVTPPNDMTVLQQHM